MTRDTSLQNGTIRLPTIPLIRSSMCGIQAAHSPFRALHSCVRIVQHSLRRQPRCGDQAEDDARKDTACKVLQQGGLQDQAPQAGGWVSNTWRAGYTTATTEVALPPEGLKPIELRHCKIELLDSGAMIPDRWAGTLWDQGCSHYTIEHRSDRISTSRPH